MELRTTFSLSYKLKALLVIVLSTLFTGCATGPKFKLVSPPENKAILYFYQPIPISGSLGEKLELRVNGESIAVLPYGAYTYVVLSEGEHLIEVYERNSLKWTTAKSRGRPKPKFIDTKRFKANETLFLKYSQRSVQITNNVGVGSSEYGYKEKPEALKTIKSTRLVKGKTID